MTAIIVTRPRHLLQVEEVNQFWGLQKNGYTSIQKLGYDENCTTLAVNAYLDLAERLVAPPSRLYLAALPELIEFGVFLTSTGLQAEQVELIAEGEISGILAVKSSLESRSSAFLVVDAPTAKDLQLDSFLGAVAIAGQFTKCIKLKSFTATSGLHQSHQNGSEFVGRNETALIRAIPKEKNLILSSFAIGLHNNQIQDAQKASGFVGSSTAVQELAYWIGKAEHVGQSIQLIATEAHRTVVLSLNYGLQIEHFKTTPTKPLLYSKFLQKRNANLLNDPARIAQGAYISSSSYLAEAESRYKLRASQCQTCNAVNFPPRRVCKACGKNTAPGPYLSRNATVVTLTSILKGAAPSEFDFQQQFEGEYIVAIVKFPEGPQVIAQITDCSLEDLQIGDEVQMVLRRIYFQDNLNRYGYKFIKKYA